jgi:hypothetical protein
VHFFYILLYVHCVVACFFLKIKLDSKSRDSFVEIIALRIYSHARWVILFQVQVQLVEERHVSLRPLVYVSHYLVYVY